MLTLWRKWIAFPIGWLVIMVVLLGIEALSQIGDTSANMSGFRGAYIAVSTGDQVELHVTETITVKLDSERGI